MASLPTNLCELFAQSVRRYPENLAIEHEDGSFTYRELNDASSLLACDLTLLGVGGGSPVLLVTAHGSFNIIAILAILKAGGCFVPIDRKAWSSEMINYVCDTVESRIVINTTPEPFSIPNGSHHVLHLTSLPPTSISSHAFSPLYPQLSNDDACIIFTSGSTGSPKGVILSHKSLCLYSMTSPMNLDIIPGDRLLHILSVAFDACACMLFSALGHGGTVVPTQAEDIYAKAPSCTVMAATPSILSSLIDSAPDTNIFRNFHTIILGGETASPDLLLSLVEAGVRILVGYGATETTSMGSVHIVVPDTETKTVNPQLIGGSTKESPISLVNSDFQLIDDNFVEGEIIIAGDGLSRGYYKDDAKTNTSFVHLGSLRVYKTGDYGRWVPSLDGGRLIEFRGRKDRTVKNGGFLVNLDRDVEKALSYAGTLLGVTSVCAAVTEDGIIAVVTPESVDTVALLAKARESMCTYCIPYRIEAVDSFPMSSNGKIQHKKVMEIISTIDGGQHPKGLPTTLSLPISRRPDAKIAEEEEERLPKILEVVSNLFGFSDNGLKRVQASDSFLSLGGSSLLAFKLVSALRKLNVSIAPKDLFSCHTFEEIAKSSSNTIVAEKEAAQSLADKDVVVAHKLATLRNQAKNILGLENDSFDIGPLTSLQLALALPTLNCSSKNVNQIKLTYKGEFSAIIERAWRTVWQAEPVFRTEICLTIGCGAQIIHKHPMRNHKAQFFTNLADYEKAVLEADVNVGLGCSLEFIAYYPVGALGATTADNTTKGAEELTIVLTIHHSLMDGISLQTLLANVERATRGRQLSDSPSSIDANLELISVQQKQDANARKFFSEYLQKVKSTKDVLEARDVAMREPMSGIARNSTLLFGSSAHSDEVSAFATLNCVSQACIYYAAWAMAMSTFQKSSTTIIGSVFSNRASQPEFQDAIGLYMSTLPLVVNITAKEEIKQLLQRIMSDILILGEYAWARSDQVGIGSYMSSLVALQPSLPDERSNPPAIRAESSENSEFPLSLLIESSGEFRILYNNDMFDESTVQRLGGHFKQALRGILHHTMVSDCMRLNEIQEMAYQQAQNVRIEQNHQTVKRALEESIDRFREYAALEDCRGNTLTYGQLERQTNIIANEINESLASTEATSVAVYGDGSVGWLLGLIGILKTSRTFVPLDPKWSMERKAMVLKASGAAAIIVSNHAQQNEVPMIAEKKALVVDQMLSLTSNDERAARLPEAGSADSILVFIFTSGTTGAPKGIPTTHRSFLAFQSNPEATMFAAPGRRIAQFMSPAFDACNEEIFSALLHGATLVLRDPADPYAHLQRVNTVTMTPAVLSVLEPDQYPNLEIIYSTGEAITAPIVQKFSNKKLLYNAYGPAECSISTSFERMIEGDVITIGRATATARMYLLDEEQKPVPNGVQGEIYLAGVQVLERYINAPEQTALRVLPDPWHSKERMYRTGDYGTCVLDGRVIYKGRIDRQVKIRGFRVELDGVENAILAAPTVDGISQCAVLAIDGVLVAYIKFGFEDPQITKQERINRLRDRLVKTQLPSWVPQQIISIVDFPKSANGKVDNKALELLHKSKTFLHDEAVSRAAMPTNDYGVTSKLSEAWREILQLMPHVDLRSDDNFFSLGGHSVLVLLLATKLTATFEIEITSRELLPAPIFQAQVDIIERLLEAKRAPDGHMKEASKKQVLPTEELTELEKQVWFQYQVATTTTAFNIANVLDISGQLDYTRLVDSFNTALASDPILRSNFSEGPNGLKRIMRSSAPQIRKVELLDIVSEVNYAFDLAYDELIRVHIVYQPDESEGAKSCSTARVTIVTSHSIADLGTLQNLLQLVSDAYVGKSIKVYERPHHLDSSQWYFTPSLLQQEFWRDYLSKSDTKSIQPSHFQLPLLPSVAASFDGTSRTCEFNGNVITRLNSLIERLGITQHHMALTIAALLLQWLLEKDDIIVGAPNANRYSSTEREALGQFLDRLPIRIKLDCSQSTAGDTSLAKILTNMRDSAVDALVNAIPFSKILEALDISSGELQHPIFDCMVTFHPRSSKLDTYLQLPNCDVAVSPQFAEGSKFPLMMEWFELEEDRWLLHIEHDTNRLPSAIIDTMEHVLETILDAIADECSLLDLHARIAAATKDGRNSTNDQLATTASSDKHGLPGLGLLSSVFDITNIIQEEMKLCLGTKNDVEISPHSSFFSAGADSNAAVALRHRLRARGFKVSLRAIFTAQSPLELVRHITV
ncbi:non-ribosomal peptide synthetase [Trichoderma chlorosporum]